MIQVLDESLRATSGFKGTDELIDDRLLHTPFTSDCIRSKKISSAPSYEFDGLVVSESNPTSYSSGIKQWCEAIEKHLPLTLSHSSPMVGQSVAKKENCFIYLFIYTLLLLIIDHKLITAIVLI